MSLVSLPRFLHVCLPCCFYPHKQWKFTAASWTARALKASAICSACCTVLSGRDRSLRRKRSPAPFPKAPLSTVLAARCFGEICRSAPWIPTPRGRSGRTKSGTALVCQRHPAGFAPGAARNERAYSVLDAAHDAAEALEPVRVRVEARHEHRRIPAGRPGNSGPRANDNLIEGVGAVQVIGLHLLPARAPRPCCVRRVQGLNHQAFAREKHVRSTPGRPWSSVRCTCKRCPSYLYSQV